jgi:hypothetical protein
MTADLTSKLGPLIFARHRHSYLALPWPLTGGRSWALNHGALSAISCLHALESQRPNPRAVVPRPASVYGLPKRPEVLDNASAQFAVLVASIPNFVNAFAPAIGAADVVQPLNANVDNL